MPLDDRMIWIDTETFGLNVKTDYLLEVGFKITDYDLNTIDDFQTTIWDTPTYDERYDICLESDADEYVRNMHINSGLFKDAINGGASVSIAEQEICDWLEGHGIRDGKEPLCGSSVHFDRGMLEVQMPKVFERFHYRIVDNSVLKELCAAFASDMYAHLMPGRNIHRVLPDLEDTINEFRFYRDNFLWDTRPGVPL